MDPATPAPAGQVQMVNHEGEPFVVPAADVAQNEAAGLRVVSDPAELNALKQKARFDSPGGAALSFAAGAGRGLTFGLSDLALTRSGLVAPDTLKGLQEANPNADLAGNVVGAVAPALLTDGASLGAEGLEGASLLSRFGRAASAPTRAVGLLGEGAAGVGESLGLGTMGQAALRGAAEGAAYQVGNNLSEDVIQDKALTAQSLFHDVGTTALFGGAAGGTIDKVLGAVAEHAPPLLAKAEAKLTALADRAATGVDQAAVSKALTEADGALASVAEHLNAEAMPQRLRQIMQDAPAAPGLDGALRGAAHGLADAGVELADVAPLFVGAKEVGAARTLADQHEALAAVAKEVGDKPQVQAAVQQLLQSPTFGPAAEYTARTAQVLEPVRAARAAVEAAADPAARAEAIATFKEASSDALAKLHEDTYRHLGGRPVSLDALQGHLDALSPTGEHMPGAEHTPSLLHTFGSVAGMLPGGHAIAAPLHALSALGEVATVFRGGQSATIARIVRRAGDAVTTIKQGVQAALGVGGERAAKVAVATVAPARRAFESGPAAVARRADAVRAVAASPQSIPNRLAAGAPVTTQHAPTIGNELAATTARGASYLAKAAPKDPRTPSPLPGQSKWLPSPSEVAAYLQVERAVTQPLTLVQDFKEHVLVPSAVDAVRTVHPDLYARIVSETMDGMGKRSAALPYETQLQVDILIGKPVSPMAQAQGFLQSTALLAGASKPPTPSSAGPDVAGLSDLKGSAIH